MVEDEQGRTGAVRASDSEREEALRSLAAHFAEGRLNRTEFDERADTALEARTRDDLHALFTDLPSRPPGEVVRQDAGAQAPKAPVGPGGLPGGRRVPMRAGGPPLFPLVPVLLALSVVAVVHGLPPFPLIALLALLAANRRRQQWGRPDPRSRP